jgi:hypothetical protein
MSHAATALHRPVEEPVPYAVMNSSAARPGPKSGRPGGARHVGNAPGHAEVRRLTVLFQRNPEQDHQDERVRYEGYHICWPDGAAVSVSTRRFCQQGCRLLGLGRHMRDKTEQLVELGLHPVTGLEAPLTRLGPGIRTRRFYIERDSDAGRLFFFNGSPTEVEFDVHQDDARILQWFSLPTMRHRERLWFDLSAKSME